MWDQAHEMGFFNSYDQGYTQQPTDVASNDPNYTPQERPHRRGHRTEEQKLENITTKLKKRSPEKIKALEEALNLTADGEVDADLAKAVLAYKQEHHLKNVGQVFKELGVKGGRHRKDHQGQDEQPQDEHEGKQKLSREERREKRAARLEKVEHRLDSKLDDEQTKEMETKLSSLGYDVGEVDGKADKDLAKAYLKYKHDNHIKGGMKKVVGHLLADTGENPDQEQPRHRERQPDVSERKERFPVEDASQVETKHPHHQSLLQYLVAGDFTKPRR